MSLLQSERVAASNRRRAFWGTANQPTDKRCPICFEVKPRRQFGTRPNRRGQPRSNCRQCESAKVMYWRKNQGRETYLKWKRQQPWIEKAATAEDYAALGLTEDGLDIPT